MIVNEAVVPRSCPEPCDHHPERTALVVVRDGSGFHWLCANCRHDWMLGKPSPSAATTSGDDEDGEPCPECGHPFGTPPDPLAPTCRYCQVPSPTAANRGAGVPQRSGEPPRSTLESTATDPTAPHPRP